MVALPASDAAPESEDAPIATIRDGLFFTMPAALPVGRHNLSTEDVREAQRERSMAAVSELLAAHGYRGFGVGEIAKRARISLAAFYRCFDGKDACVFAGYDRFIEVLVGRMLAADVAGVPRPGTVATLIDTYLETMQLDPVVARAYPVEIDALGPPARARRRESLGLLARYLRDLHSDAPPLPWTAWLGAVYAVRQLAVDHLDEHDEPDLTALGGELRPWLEDLFRLPPD
jgi:AcrR family transcriptional regulator